MLILIVQRPLHASVLDWSPRFGAGAILGCGVGLCGCIFHVIAPLFVCLTPGKFISISTMQFQASQVAFKVNNSPAGDIRNWGSIPGSGISPGGGNGNPLQYSCLENPMDRGAWRATVRKESDTTEVT